MKEKVIITLFIAVILVVTAAVTQGAAKEAKAAFENSIKRRELANIIDEQSV